MKQYGLQFGGKLHISFINEGEGDYRDFNSRPFALRILNEDFQRLMDMAAEHLGRNDLLALQGEKTTLITDAPCYDGVIDAVYKYLSAETDGFQITKVPRVPRASELTGYREGDCWWKPLPIGLGFHLDFRCVEIGVTDGDGGADGEIIYRCRDWHQEFIGDQVKRIKGDVTNGRDGDYDLFGCCLHAWHGDTFPARELSQSKYIAWAKHVALSEACEELRRQTALMIIPNDAHQPLLPV